MKQGGFRRLWVFAVAAALLGLGESLLWAQAPTNASATARIGWETNLPVLSLQITNPVNSETKVPCVLRVDLPPGQAWAHTNVLTSGVRIHGASSRAYPKKSYGLTLDEPAPLLGFPASAHWILNAAYIDRSLMRHKLAYDLFRSLGGPGTNRFAAGSRFVEVNVNGKYNGVYLLMQRVDKQLMGLRSYQSNDTVHACIYKAVDHAANFSMPGHGGYEQRDPDPTTRPYWDPLDEFNRFVSRATAEEFSDPQTGIAARLDLDNAIDFHLLVLLAGNGDGITKNFFLAREGQATGPAKQRFSFAPWDYDGSLGRSWDTSRVPPSIWLSNHLFERLRQVPAYREKFVARWTHLSDHQFSMATVQGLIDVDARTLGEAARRNASRWPAKGWPYHDQLTFDDDLAQMKEWVKARVEWMDGHINRNFGAQAK